MPFELEDNDTPRQVTITSGSAEARINVTGSISVQDLLDNQALLARLGVGGNLKAVDADTGDTLNGPIDSSVDEIELVATGSDKG